MIKIVADGYVKPEYKERYLELAKELVEETRKEEGNISYALHQDRADEYHLTFIEEWKDAEAIENHNNSAHFTRIVPMLGELRAKPGTVALYDELFL